MNVITPFLNGDLEDPIFMTQPPGCTTSGQAHLVCRCQVERSMLWEITESLGAASNDLRVGIQLLFFKSKIIIKQTVFNRAHTKDPRPTSSTQR